MAYKCKVTVLKREFYKDLAEEYLADPSIGPCEIFTEGQEWIFDRQSFWRMPQGFCSEAWGAICRYIDIQISGGIVMEGWTNNDKIFIGCCSDGVRPVIFKVERIETD